MQSTTRQKTSAAGRDHNKSPSPSRPNSTRHIQHSPSGVPDDERRDDDEEASPDGPLSGLRREEEDSDVEGVPHGSHSDVERE